MKNNFDYLLDRILSVILAAAMALLALLLLNNRLEWIMAH